MGDIQGTGTGSAASTGSIVTLKYYGLDTCGNAIDSSTKEQMGEFALVL